MYVCMYVYIHKCVYIDVRMYIYIYMYMYIYFTTYIYLPQTPYITCLVYSKPYTYHHIIVQFILSNNIHIIKRINIYIHYINNHLLKRPSTPSKENSPSE